MARPSLTERIARFARRGALRLRVWWSRWSLDNELAAGVDPASNPALCLRAAQLGSPGHRRRLAGCLERLVGESEVDRLGGLSAAVPVVRAQVAEARQSLLLMADLLRSADRIRPRGIAAIERMLTNGGSILYVDSARGAVELQVRIVLDWLVVEEESTPEAWFPAASVGSGELVTPLSGG